LVETNDMGKKFGVPLGTQYFITYLTAGYDRNLHPYFPRLPLVARKNHLKQTRLFDY